MAVVTMTAKEVAEELGVSPTLIKSAILNGTMPVGLVMQGAGKERSRTVIIKTRWDAWINAKDLTKGV